jgi:uncharacterized protein
MTKEQIDKLILELQFRENSEKPELIETHISWVILYGRYAYKIKKSINYSFLDFSTLEKRKYFCEREIALNKRFTEYIYIDVQPVKENAGRYSIGEKEGETIDFAVKMRRVDTSLQMDVLLSKNKVTPVDIRNLAEKIASFHKRTTIIYDKDLLDVHKKFKDLEAEKAFLDKTLNKTSCAIIDHAVNASDLFIKRNTLLLVNRLRSGFFRDCHGDLHTRNIFLLPDPQPFDCIEFNDDYRQIDVLNEVAFLCMDLDASGRRDLSDLFMKYYNDYFPCMNNRADHLLFIYYKSYRANVRAKINSIRAQSAGIETIKNDCLAQTEKYLTLMNEYITCLQEK